MNDTKVNTEHIKRTSWKPNHKIAKVDLSYALLKKNCQWERKK